jgi:trigger factor
VPESLVERQIEKRLETIARQIQGKGVNPQSLDWGRMRAAQRDAAVDDVKSTFILEKLASENQIQVDPAEVQKEIQTIATATRQTPEVIEAHLTKDGGLDRMKSRLRIEKALDFVYQLARMDA